ncbi:MAG TPA: nucleotidyltransferase family protein [Gaiellaceae bacterium]|nr:nucleotidyltransferase family protein [Gaiellaceae bacterium]
MDLWSRLDAAVDRAPSVAALHHHRLHLYAAWRWRSAGRTIPPELAALERGAATLRMGLAAMASYVRHAVDGPVVLLKGADVAALYPRPELRPSGDLDVLVADAAQAYRALLRSGFREDEATPQTPTAHHHLAPLLWPGLAGRVELHSAPNWPLWLAPPPASEIIEAASGRSQAGDGILALSPAHRTAVLVAHLWRENPLGRLGQLLDVILSASHADPDAIAETMRRWRLERLWATTLAVASQIFADRSEQRRARFLSRPLRALHERSALEAKVAEAVAPFYGLRPPHSIVASGATVTRWLRPDQNETWRDKMRRTLKMTKQLASPVSIFVRRWEDEHRRRPPGG